MQSKVILATTGLLILLPTIYFFFFEFTQGSIGQRFLLSLFQAITPVLQVSILRSWRK